MSQVMPIAEKFKITSENVDCLCEKHQIIISQGEFDSKGWLGRH